MALLPTVAMGAFFAAFAEDGLAVGSLIWVSGAAGVVLLLRRLRTKGGKRGASRDAFYAGLAVGAQVHVLVTAILWLLMIVDLQMKVENVSEAVLWLLLLALGAAGVSVLVFAALVLPFVIAPTAAIISTLCLREVAPRVVEGSGVQPRNPREDLPVR